MSYIRVESYGLTYRLKANQKRDKKITIEFELHTESSLDAATSTWVRIYSQKGSWFDISMRPIDSLGNRIASGHILRGTKTISKHSAHGYWAPDQITLKDAQGNERHGSQTDFGWKLYVNNPLADDTPPAYVKNSMRLSLSESTEVGRPIQILTAHCRIFEEIGVDQIYATLNDSNSETYSKWMTKWGYNPQTGEASVILEIPDYFQSGTYALNYIEMRDIALNVRGVYFTDPGHRVGENREVIDELPATIEIQTTNPDTIPPVLDLNAITIQAKPTNPQAPNGETQVDITFRIKDNISGYSKTAMYLRDPNGVRHHFWHHGQDFHKIYFSRDPIVYETYERTIILPVGSIPGTWGLAEMQVYDKAYNTLRVDFTEIIRFEVSDTPLISADFDGDGQVAFERLFGFCSCVWNPQRTGEL